MALETKERFDGNGPFRNKRPWDVSSATSEDVSQFAEVSNCPMAQYTKQQKHGAMRLP